MLLRLPFEPLLVVMLLPFSIDEARQPAVNAMRKVMKDGANLQTRHHLILPFVLLLRVSLQAVRYMSIVFCSSSFSLLISASISSCIFASIVTRSQKWTHYFCLAFFTSVFFWFIFDAEKLCLLRILKLLRRAQRIEGHA